MSFIADKIVMDGLTSVSYTHLYINSPGGSVYAGLGIYDTMQFINSDVATICTGMAASMAAVLLVEMCIRDSARIKHMMEEENSNNMISRVV